MGGQTHAEKGFRRWAIILALVVVFTAVSANALAGADSMDDTLLMFVGEDLDILSIASRREESAWQAPAVGRVLTRKEMEERGVLSLAEALSSVPGFFMAEKEWGVMPYMRGIPNSVLFLHDTVPVGSDVNKSLNPIGRELSLNAVKRIEIIRGPGSVLWGADAFAGIVNVVPLSGKDFSGVETGIFAGGPLKQRGVYLNMGRDTGVWDGFASVTARSEERDNPDYDVVSFWNDNETPTEPEERFGSGSVGREQSVDAVGNISMGDAVTLSGRTSVWETPYVLSGDGDFGKLTWPEERRVFSGYLKAEGRKETGLNSAFRILGSYNWLNSKWEIIDRCLKQQEETFYGELLYDRQFFSGIGLSTIGVSYREKYVTDAPIWDGYLYDYLGDVYTQLMPDLTLADYHSSLWSFFGQYTHKLRNLDLLAGIRYDEHSEYEDNVSFNYGVVWNITDEIIFKLLNGTAYRTPFSRQLMADEQTELEKIRSRTYQLGWQPSDDFNLSLVVFDNEIRNHIMQDQYAGLSLPNSQDTQGIEVDLQWKPLAALELRGNITLLDHSGPDELYKYNDYDEPGPDPDELVPHYTDLLYPYDAGAETLANLMGVWRITEKISTSLRVSYIGSRRLIFPRGDGTLKIDDTWLGDASILLRDVRGSGIDIGLTLKNITDEDYPLPGTYHTIPGKPFGAEITITKKW